MHGYNKRQKIAGKRELTFGLKFSNGQVQASVYVVTGANTTKNWTYHVTGHEKKCARKWCQKFSTFYDITFAFGKMWL